MKHCCEDMIFFLNEKKVGIQYNNTERLYSINLITSGGLQKIYFCPWCGSKLPKDLTDELSEIVFDELNLDGFDDPRLPEEFKSDEWWKKRGL